MTSFSDQGALGIAGTLRSGMVWGDYDADGDLDVAIAGSQSVSSSVPSAVIYRNDSGSFNDISANLTGVRNGSTSWADYDQDGDLDLLVSGFDSTSATISKLYRNDSGVFNEVSAGFMGVRYSSSSWADYDNDGDLDLLLAGRNTSNTNIAKIYRNDGNGTFAESSVSLPGASFGSVAWGDYDSDGDQDLLVSGTSSGGRVSAIYRNDGNETFTDISAGLLQLNNSSAAWGDYDNDGDLDLLFIGQDGSGAQQSRIYRNDGNNTFTDISAALPGLFYGAVAWGDLDNDGDLDAILTGRASGSIRTTKVFVNNAGTFSDDGSAYAGFDLNSVALGDYDNDGDLDFIVSGRAVSSNLQAIVYRNDISTVNTAPTSPGNLTASESSSTSLTFSWSAPTDSQTASAGLSYNLRVGTTPGGSNVFASMANASNGRPRIPARGPIQGTSFTLKGLTAGQTYYWSVQAIDPSFAGSAFATEANAAINAAPTAVSASPNPASIAENSSTSSRVKVADLSVTDDGRGTNSLTLTGTDQASFEVIGTELFLKSGVTLNYENKTSYSVTVNVDDATVGSNPDASTSFTLNVTDVNEAPTALGLQNTTPSLAENTSTASAIKLADISVTDDALGTNDLSLSGADSAFFEIVGSELRLVAGTVLDFEAKSAYDVTVEVNDAAVGGAVDALQTFTLTITDVNEAPTALGLQNTTTSLAENTSTASAIKLADISVTDDALGTNDLSLSGADSAFFEIVGSELRLKAGTVLDFESQTTYDVTVEVNDASVGGAVDASQNFTLTITDFNEAPTSVALQNTTTFLAENTSTAVAIKVADILVTDDALGTNDLSLSGTDAAFFEIVGSELRLVAGTVLDFETQSSYSVTVEVNDAAVGGAVDASTAFTLTLENLPDTTLGADAFVLTYSALDVTVTHGINGGVPVIVGKYLLTSPITLDGLAADDSVRVVGTSGDDEFLVESTGLSINGASLILNGAAAITLAGVAGNDTYRFDTDAALGLFTLEDSAGTFDTISMAPTSTLAVTLDLSVSTVQIINSNLSLKLNSPMRFENAVGGDLDDVLNGNAANNQLIGNGGNDRLTGRAGDDDLLGGFGDDTYLFGDALTAESDVVTEVAGQGIDTLSFRLVTSDITLTLLSSLPRLIHSHRTFRMVGSKEIENIVGGSGNDNLRGNEMANILTGNDGNDRLTGAEGDDQLIGGKGDDTYAFGQALTAETDTVTEAANGGTDLLAFRTVTDDITLRLNTALPQAIHSNRTLRLIGANAIEDIFSGSGNDTLTGNDLSNMLTGNEGADMLTGGRGDDQLSGGLGDDRYVFAATTTSESDFVDEQVDDGVDILDFSSLTTTVSVNIGVATAQVVHANRTLTLRGAAAIESVLGGSGADVIVGNSLDNFLTGNGGNDILVGGPGNDHLYGNAGRDILIGGLGRDDLDGGVADDILIAGRTSSDVDNARLTDLRTEWISGGSYATRVTNLRAGVGTTSASLKATVNVVTDAGEDDILTGDADLDWFFAAINDSVTDLLTGETLDAL